jgi:hypothetical protein
MVRDCRAYTRQSGQWWWKRNQVDYRACVDDPATEGDLKVIGEIELGQNPPPLLSRYTLACDFCRHGRPLKSVDVPLGVGRENGMATLKMPPNLVLHEEEVLQLMYTPAANPRTTPAVELPYVQ